MKIQESFLSSSLIFFSTGSDSCFWEFHPSSVILGVFVFFFILIFCESLALYAKSRGLTYTMCTFNTNILYLILMFINGRFFHSPYIDYVVIRDSEQSIPLIY